MMSENSGILREPTDIRIIRLVLNHWPLPRGKSFMLRLFWPRIAGREFLMFIEKDVYVPADLSEYLLMMTFIHGYRYDPAMTLSRRLLSPNDIVLDVGANVGLWAMGAARKVGAEGHVHAFEPVPSNYQHLVSNLRLNGIANVETSRVALADTAGEATFFIPAATGERGTKKPHATTSSGLGSLARREGINEEIRVPVRTIDSYLQERSLSRVDFIKIDVEGAEQLAFRGAATLLSRNDAPMIMFEADDRLAQRFGSSCSAVKSLLAGFGYSIFAYEHGKFTRVAVGDGHIGRDLFAFKSHHVDRLGLCQLPIPDDLRQGWV
jgi:FkbM family methyltransferase